jgi:DNA-binding MarR family transcriptional regulator
MVPQALAHYARVRLALTQRERIRFRLSPQISLEILLILAAEQGSAPLTGLFEQIAAAEKSIRSHIRALMASGLVDDAPHATDGRAKLLRLTPRGIEDLAAYVEECSGHLGRIASFQA